MRRQTGTLVQSELQGLGYLAQTFYSNAASFGVPQSRTRVYIVGVLVARTLILHTPDIWCQWLED